MKNFLFPIETTSRELDHKILIGIKVAAEDRKVIIADQQYIRLLSFYLKGGVFFGKHLFGKPKFSDDAYYKRLKQRNFNVVHLNEEGAVWPGNEADWQSILQQAERPSVLSQDDYMITWGDWQKIFNQSYEKSNVNIKSIGHSRFDLYREKFRSYFQSDVDKIKKKYGDYILVNTSFSYSNNGEGGVQFIFKPTISYDASRKEDRIYRFKRWQQQMISMSDIVELINQINLEFPEKIIILRPHPSEDTALYRNIFQNIENVVVKYEGPVTPWIFGCSLLIHNGCTTGIEATLANKPVINYTSLSKPLFDVYLANRCGETFNSAREVLDFIKKVEALEYQPSMPSDDMSLRLFNNFKNEDTATDIADVIEKAASTTNSKTVDFNFFAQMTFSVLFQFYDKAKYIYLVMKGKKKKYDDYRKRFEKFDKEDIQERVKNLSAILKKDVEVEFIDSHCFIIKRR